MIKKYSLFTAGLLAAGMLSAQTTLYTENFNGGTHTFTLNSSDVSSSGTTNSWQVNNSYTGGSSSFVCFGFPFSFTVANTANQPAGITGSPTSNYLHISSAAGTSSGITNANYLAADGLCTLDESYFAKMSADISTIGMTNVNFTFWWMCVAEPGVQYGQAYYSTDGGTNWTLISSPFAEYSGQAAWTQQSITNPAFDNQATLRFGFKFNNTTSAGSPSDPPFCIDDISITGSTACSNTTSSFTANNCSSYTVPSGDETYTVSGTYMDTIPNAGGCDSIMTIMVNILNTSNTLSVNACGSYTVPSGDEIYTVSGTYMDTIPNMAGCDSLLTIQLSILNTSNTVSINACGSYTVPSGDEMYTVSGTYMDTIPNMAGCDSVLTINLTINTVDVSTTVSANGDSITANDLSALSYQWLDCSNGNAVIPGATSQSFAPATNGSYAVVVNTGSCADTSACVTISAIGLAKHQEKTLIYLFPNPANEILNIELSTAAEVAIVNLLGETLMSRKLDAGKNTISINELSPGVYFVNAFFNNTLQSFKLVKE